MSMTIKVEHLQRGQPRPYADHTYTSRITIEGERSWDRLLEGQVRDLVRACVHPFQDEPKDHWSPKLRSLHRVSEEKLSDHPLGAQREVWEATVTVAFTD